MWILKNIQVKLNKRGIFDMKKFMGLVVLSAFLAGGQVWAMHHGSGEIDCSKPENAKKTECCEKQATTSTAPKRDTHKSKVVPEATDSSSETGK